MDKKGKIIGITGGVGTGKSTVLNILKTEYNAHIIQADIVGHELMAIGGKAYSSIIKEFGESILSDDLQIDRKILGNIVFSDENKLKKLESIIHPLVKEEIIQRINDIRSSKDENLIIIEAALLIEDNYDVICDEMWYIYTVDDIRFTRLNKSRGYTYEKFISIINNQLPQSTYREKCRYTIDNSYDLENTRNQIRNALEGTLWL